MRLFSYKLTHDTGFAPNPFHGVLTLATCKPGIRKTKKSGDWIAGFVSSALVWHSAARGVTVHENSMVYLARVSERLLIEDYYLDPRFKNKIAEMDSRDPRLRAGDNIYRRVSTTEFEQLPNPNHNKGNLERDISGEYVLVSGDFYYFGREAIEIPHDIKLKVPVGPSRYGYQTHDENQAAMLIRYVAQNFKPGRNGLPCMWDRPNGCSK